MSSATVVSSLETWMRGAGSVSERSRGWSIEPARGGPEVVVEASDVDHAWSRARGLLARALGLPMTDETVGEIVALDRRLDSCPLDADDRLARVRLADRVSAWAQARASRVLADYVGPETGDVDEDRHLRLEVRIARGISDSAAGNDITAARALAAQARPVRDLWSRGAIAYRHVAAVLDRVGGLHPDLASEVVEIVAERLPGSPSTGVRAKVARVIARLDPEAAGVRAREARRYDVGVSFRSLPDGLGQVVATLPVESARAVVERVDTLADEFLVHQRGCEPCRGAVPDEIGPARAHAFLGLLGLDARGNPRPGSAASSDGSTGRAGRRRGELQVVVDLATLLGLADEPGLLNGQPVPATIARELAGECGSLRRVVTDPVDGHLLDYGTRTYLPDPLRTFLVARDGHCQAPGCGQPAARSQLDHVVPFPHGPSSVGNGQMVCKRDHDSKTAGDLEITSHHADGSATWRTRDGQAGTTPPRPYLADPRDRPPPRR